MSDFSGIERSALYQQCQAEKAELDRHKWYLSERAGHDVGLDYAQWNWIMTRHRSRWIEAYHRSGAQS